MANGTINIGPEFDHPGFAAAAEDAVPKVSSSDFGPLPDLDVDTLDLLPGGQHGADISQLSHTDQLGAVQSATDYLLTDTGSDVEAGKVFLEANEAFKQMGLMDEVDWDWEDSVYANDPIASAGLEEAFEGSLMIDQGLDPAEVKGSDHWFTENMGLGMGSVLSSHGFKDVEIRGMIDNIRQLDAPAGTKVYLEIMQSYGTDPTAGQAGLNPSTWGAKEWLSAAGIMMSWMMHAQSQKENKRRWDAQHDIAVRKQDAYEQLRGLRPHPMQGQSSAGGSRSSAPRSVTKVDTSKAQQYAAQKAKAAAPAKRKYSIYQ